MADLIDRQKAIDALEKDKAETDHIIMGMSGAEKEFSYHLAQRNQLDCDIDTIKRLPSAEPQKVRGKDTIPTAWIREQMCNFTDTGIEALCELLKRWRERADE